MTIIEKIVIEDNSNIIRTLQSKNKNLQEQLAEKDEEIQDLKVKLRESIHMNNINENQALLALKQDLGAALKLRHAQFIENQTAVCNADNYEALKASIYQIFRVLKRYKIEF